MHPNLPSTVCPSTGLNLTRLGHEYGADTVDKVQHALEPFIDRGLGEIHSIGLNFT